MSRSQGNLLLIVAAALWGFGYVAQKMVLEHLDPFSAVGLRCLIGGVLILILLLLPLDRGGALAPGYWPSAIRVAALLALVLLMLQIAVISTTVTNASLLVNTAAVMTHMLAWIVYRERPSLHVCGAAGVTLIGVFMLCGGLQKFGQGEFLPS